MGVWEGVSQTVHGLSTTINISIVWKSWVQRFKPRVAGWEAPTLPLCHFDQNSSFYGDLISRLLGIISLFRRRWLQIKGFQQKSETKKESVRSHERKNYFMPERNLIRMMLPLSLSFSHTHTHTNTSCKLTHTLPHLSTSIQVAALMSRNRSRWKSIKASSLTPPMNFKFQIKKFLPNLFPQPY